MTTHLRIATVIIFASWTSCGISKDVVCSATSSEWHVTEDSNDEMESQLSDAFSEQGASVNFDTAVYTFSRHVDAPDKGVINTRREDQWAARVESILHRHNFRTLSAERQRAMGINLEDAKRNGVELVPYGMRARVAGKFGSTTILMRTNDSSCAIGNGGFMAGIVAIKPVPDVGSDWGGVFVYVIGAGSCGVKTSDVNARIADVMSDISDDLCDLGGL